MNIMRFFAICCIALGLWPTPAVSRMNESVEHCDWRYGKPIATNVSTYSLHGVPTRIYHYEGFRISVSFINNRAAMLTYSKWPLAKIHDDEQLAILKGESDGEKWTRVRNLAPTVSNLIYQMVVHSMKWTKPNGAIAYIDAPFHYLTVQTPAVEKYRHEQIKAKESLRKSSIPSF